MCHFRDHFLQLQHRSISPFLLGHPIQLLGGPWLVGGTKGPKEVEIQWYSNTKKMFCKRKAQRKVEDQWGTRVLPSQLQLQWWRSIHAVVVPSDWQGWHQETIPESLLDQNTPVDLSFSCAAVRSRNVMSWVQNIPEHQDQCFLILLQVLWNYRCPLVGGWRERLAGCEAEHPSGFGLKAVPVDWRIELVFQAGKPKQVAIGYFMSLTFPFRVQAWDITWIKRLWWF